MKQEANDFIQNYQTNKNYKILKHFFGHDTLKNQKRRTAINTLLVNVIIQLHWQNFIAFALQVYRLLRQRLIYLKCVTYVNLASLQG